MITPIIPFPTRALCSGEITLATVTSLGFGGSNARQTRVLFCVQNTDATNAIHLKDSLGKLFAIIAAGAPPFALPSNMAFSVYNPSGVDVKFTVLELYPDIEGSRGEFTRQVAASGGTSGGGTSGGSGGDSLPSYSGGGRRTYTP